MRSKEEIRKRLERLERENEKLRGHSLNRRIPPEKRQNKHRSGFLRRLIVS